MGEDPYTYGETPLEVFSQIGQELGLGPDDTLLEMGCGRGLGVFHLHETFGCKVIGVDRIPEFIRIAEKVRQQQGNEGIYFRCEDILSTPLDGVTALYIAGTCFSDDLITKLNQKLQGHQLKIATISYALNEYPGGENFQILKEFDVKMPWGTTSCFINNIC